MLLKKSSLEIPLLSEVDEDKRIAKLLSMKPMRSGEENSDQKRKILLSQSSLPTANFSRKKEETAVKLLSSSKLNLGIVRKSTGNSKTQDSLGRKRPNEDANESNEPKKPSLVGDYGSSHSSSDSE